MGRFMAALAAIALVSCKGGKDEAEPAPDPGWQPDTYCPGGEACASSAGTLEAGAASVSIIPECYENWEDLDDNAEYHVSIDTFLDCGCDRLCPGDDGYSAPDEGEGDEVFQAIWIGGFGNARAANGVRDATMGLRGEGDGLWARALVLRQGDSTLGIVALDAVGFMRDDVLAMRTATADAGVDLDHLVIHSSHVHEAPDSMGIWGPNAVKTGYDPNYAGQVVGNVVSALREAESALVEVEVESGMVDIDDYPGGTSNIISDTRDPVIIDSRLGVARFFEPSGATVATLVHFGNHPETVAGDNLLLTSDFAHALRQTVESGVSWDGSSQEGVGGTCIFLNAAVGGMMTSLRADVTDPDGVVWSEHSFEKADAVGQLLGGMALDAIDAAESVGDVTLTFRANKFELPVINTGFQAMFEIGVLAHRTIYNYDPEENISADNQPDVETEVDFIQIGDLQMITIPGELLPEVGIGGYNGSFTPADKDIVDPENSNPPDLASSPEGPYLLDRLDGRMNWVIGLGNDELGYFIAPYNFVLADVGAYILEAEGDHYEETNSLGPDTATLIDEQVERLAGWKP